MNKIYEIMKKVFGADVRSVKGAVTYTLNSFGVKVPITYENVLVVNGRFIIANDQNDIVIHDTQYHTDSYIWEDKEYLMIANLVRWFDNIYKEVK